MKYFIYSLLILANSTVFSQNATKYLNEISGEAKEIRTATWKYMQSAIKNHNTEKVEDNRLALLYSIKDSKKKINALLDFDGKTYLRDSVLSFLNLYEKVISSNYVNIMEYEKKQNESYIYKGKLVFAAAEANDKLATASEMLDEVEMKFATENKIKIVKTTTKTGEKLKKVNEVYKYYVSIFDLFFRPYGEEAQFLEALEKVDIEKMKLYKSNLISKSMESIAKLNLKSGFDGDNILILDCEKLLNFYKGESGTDFQKIIDFQVYKLAFQKKRAELEAKSAAEREKGEVANFNKHVAEYNQKLEEYNNIILNLNSKREKLINTWNTDCVAFEKKHINKK